MDPDATWSEDHCTCGHKQSEHANGTGMCDNCAGDAHYSRRPMATVCRRFQWNGEERKRTW